MLLDDLLEPRVIQLGEFRQVMNIGNNITEHLLKHHKILVGGRRARGSTALATGIGRAIQTGDHIVHLEFGLLDPVDNLLTLALLKQEHLFQLALEQGHKLRFVVLRPFFAGGLGVIGGRLVDEVGLEGFLEIVIRNVERIVLLDHGRTEIFTEPVEQLNQYAEGDTGSGNASGWKIGLGQGITHLMLG
jgi:hypothetical protein